MTAFCNELAYIYQGTDNTGAVEMDQNEQQALLLLYQQQQHTVLHNYLALLAAQQQSAQTPVSPTGSTVSPTGSTVSPTGSTALSPSLQMTSSSATPVDSWASLLALSSQVAASPLPLTTSAPHQSITSLLTQGFPTVNSPVEKMTNSAVAHLAHLQLLALQAESQRKQKAEEDLKLLLALQNVGKLQETQTVFSELESEEITREAVLQSTKAAILSLPTPETTPSPSNEASSPVPLEVGTAQSSKAKEENDDEDMFVDVESTEDRISIKGQRKAHIDFHRKLKALRQREKILECQICHEKIENSEHNARTHVHSHSTTALYRCKMCGAESKEQSAIFAHIKQNHPNKVSLGHDGFEDRRDMANLSNILVKCFPRTAPKTKAGSSEVLEKICKNIEEKSLNKILCALCMTNVVAQKTCITRHAHAHPHYRCKQCKHTCSERATMMEHCAKVHEILDPKMSRDFNTSNAADVTASILRKCFPTLAEDS